MERNERLPISNEKTSLFRRIYNKLFYKKAEESEISKIAEQLVSASQQESKEDLGKEFVPDKRTVVYDFFKNNIPEGQESGRLCYLFNTYNQDFNEKVEFENLSSNKSSFFMTSSVRGNLRHINLGGKEISIYLPSQEAIFPKRDLWGEIICLTRYDNFVNTYNEDKTFVNELGRIITEISEQYNLDSVDESYKAGNKLYKVLGKNPIYSSVRKSFEKAHKEYIKTNASFRKSEQYRKENFDNNNGFREELKVEDVSEIKKDKNVQSKGKKELGRED